MARKTLFAMILFVMVMAIGLTQVWAKENKFESPAELADSIQTASGAELSYVQYQWGGDIGPIGDRVALSQQGGMWASRFGMQHTDLTATNDEIMAYTAKKRVGKVIVTMSLHALVEGGDGYLSVKIESAEGEKAQAEKQALEQAIQSKFGLEEEALDWTWMVRGNLSDADKGQWISEAEGALTGEYHDPNTSSYTYQTDAGSLQVMLHQDTEGRGKELILGYPAIGSLN